MVRGAGGLEEVSQAVVAAWAKAENAQAELSDRRITLISYLLLFLLQRGSLGGCRPEW